MKVWVTADTHFGHENIIDFCKRPFRNVDEMNEALIQKWNDLVRAEDVVWHLGEFGFGDMEQIQDWVRALNGEIKLIRGNHDLKSNQWYRDCGFYEVYDYPIIIKDIHFTIRSVCLRSGVKA
jgi:calcineurin-like phosphoesterase family protein